MMTFLRVSALAAITTWVLAGVAPLVGASGSAAVAQTISAPERKPAQKSPNARRPSGGPHVYLLRGLLNVFSLGMDDLAQKIQRRGINATVHNHAEWESLANDIASQYKAGRHGSIVLIGHSLGADAVMFMGEYLGKRGVPIALIVPFDGTGSFAATGNVARVMNLTQRDYAYMRRGNGFRGELQNIDVSKDTSIDHITIDKSSRLHNMVVNKIVGVLGRGGAPRPAAKPATEASAAPKPAVPAAAGEKPAPAPAAAPPAPKPTTSGTSGVGAADDKVAPAAPAAGAQPAPARSSLRL